MKKNQYDHVYIRLKITTDLVTFSQLRNLPNRHLDFPGYKLAWN